MKTCHPIVVAVADAFELSIFHHRDTVVSKMSAYCRNLHFDRCFGGGDAGSVTCTWASSRARWRLDAFASVFGGSFRAPPSKLPTFKGSWRGPRGTGGGWRSEGLKPPSTPLQAPFVPPSSPLQAPFSPPSSPLQAPFVPPFKPPWSPLKVPTLKPPSSPLQAPFKPPSCPLQAPFKPPWNPLQPPFKPPSSPFHAFKLPSPWSPLEAPLANQGPVEGPDSEQMKAWISSGTQTQSHPTR